MVHCQPDYDGIYSPFYVYKAEPSKIRPTPYKHRKHYKMARKDFVKSKLEMIDIDALVEDFEKSRYNSRKLLGFFGDKKPKSTNTVLGKFLKQS